MHDYLMSALVRERQQRLREEADSANLVRAARKLARADRRKAPTAPAGAPAVVAELPTEVSVRPIYEPTVDDAA
jgi:hypothetical protein